LQTRVPGSWFKTAALGGVVAGAMAAGAGLLAANAGAATFPPPKAKQIYYGVSDTGSRRHYFEFTDEVGRRVPLMQSFESWDGELNAAKRRWRRTNTRGVLSLSTSPCYECPEVISPRRIQRGKGDLYLLRLNDFLADWGRPVYLRLLPEMNGHWNPYAAFNADGSSRGPSHRTKQFRKAWKRMVLIVRGGPRAKVNRKLRKFGLRGIKGQGQAPKRLPKPKVSFMWVPQTHGSPRTHANRPAAYWPGGRFVDWIGADIYGKFPNFAGLERFFRARKGGFPFVIGEWAPWDRDEPSFTRRLHRWAEQRKRVKMILYYQAFGDNNPFMLRRYPASARALTRVLDSPLYPRWAPGTRPKGGGGGGGAPPG
jgi:hypothetical protein